MGSATGRAGFFLPARGIKKILSFSASFFTSRQAVQRNHRDHEDFILPYVKTMRRNSLRDRGHGARPVPRQNAARKQLASQARTTHEPKLLTAREVIELANHVLKSGEHPTQKEVEIAKRALHNPEDMEAHDFTALGERTLAKS